LDSYPNSDDGCYKMKFDTRFIKSKIGRRIFLMFGLCALMPILSLAIISYFQVSRQLAHQSHIRLQKEVKAYGLAIYQRLLFLESEMKLMDLSLNQGADLQNLSAIAGRDNNQPRRFKALALLDTNFKQIAVTSAVALPNRQFTGPEKNHLHKERTLLWTQTAFGTNPGIFMLRTLSDTQSNPMYLLAQINLSYLWGIESGTAVSPLTDILIFDRFRFLLYSSAGESHPIPEQLQQQISTASVGQLDHEFNGQRHLVAFRLLFMQPRFFTKGWHVVLCQPANYVFQPMASFRKTFPVVVLVWFLIVLLLSTSYIRKSLLPLDLLKAGMLHVADQKFHHRIDINSRDEFQELAGQFNKMSSQLNHHFKTLDTRAQIDRSVLSSLDVQTIIETAITGIQSLFASDLVVISIFDKPKDNRATTYYLHTSQSGVQKHDIAFSQEDRDLLTKQQDHLIFNKAENTPPFIGKTGYPDMQQHLVLPVFQDRQFTAVIVLATKKARPYSDADILQARQLADQICVALTNSRLLEDLNMISWGTLTALARAVDAKSPWTAGHSERVAKLGVKIGMQIGLDAKTLMHLRRAAFLHDIGKIGIRSAILDKPEKLNTQEFQIIKEHPDVGARILEPIKVFAPIIPMIRQHHERFEGGGYPQGVAGEEIHIGARILAVADMYDALVSDRPYRRGMTVEKVAAKIKKESGRAFDPKVVEAFLGILATDSRFLEFDRRGTAEEPSDQFGSNMPTSNLKMP
jgi:putative nucleotidyltransferase with HDIG domain